MHPPTLRRVHIITWGCQMNVYDSARMKDLLHPLGYVSTDNAEQADIIILNTCHIRERATEKVFSELGRLRQIKEDRKAQGHATLLGVAGCVAQAEGQEITKRAPYVDLVTGPQAYHRLPEMILRISRAGGKEINIDFPAESKFDFLPDQTAPQNTASLSAFLNIQEGCDKFCTYCVVPYTRGSEQSRPMASVLEEARRMTARGVREITLLGQNVNGYHGADDAGGTKDIAALMDRLAEIPDLLRIRYTTSHPNDMSESLYAAHQNNPKLMPYLHLPVQSGSNRILKAMNRGHTREDYFRQIEKLRRHRPDIALSSDFIVGFPGETQQDFQDTLDLVRQVGFASAYSFKYSPRPGTPAAALPNQVPAREQKCRLAVLQDLLRQQQNAFNESLVGSVQEVLVSGPGRKTGQMTGRSPYLQPVHFQGDPELTGKIARVKITKRLTNSLDGKLA